jgi:hypothetical protein
MNWQSIETAPAEEDVLVADAKGDMAIAVFTMEHDTAEPDWVYAHYPWDLHLDFVPEYWASLPEAPQ